MLNLLDEVDHQRGVISIVVVDGIRKLEDHLVVVDLDCLIRLGVSETDRKSHGAHPGLHISIDGGYLRIILLLILILVWLGSIQVGGVYSTAHAGRGLDDLPVMESHRCKKELFFC